MNTSSEEASIRKANLQDASTLKRCIDRAYAPVKRHLSDLPDVSAGLEEDIAANTVLVAETGGKVAGCAILSIENETAHLMNIAVDPDFKGLGIGRKLIEAVEDCARRCGAAAIRLATHTGMPENVSLYRHLGWSETSRSDNKVMMVKEI